MSVGTKRKNNIRTFETKNTTPIFFDSLRQGLRTFVKKRFKKTKRIRFFVG